MPISIPTSIAGISVPGAVNGPLNALYGNKYELTNLRYPRDLGSNPNRKHVIRFTVLTPDPENKAAVDVNAGFSKMGAILGEAFNKSKIKPTDPNSDLQKAASNVTGVTGAAMAVVSGEIPLELATETAKSAGQWANSLATTRLNRRNSTTIGLYIPDGLSVSYSAIYQDEDVSAALGRPFFLAQGATSLYDSFVGGESGSKNLFNAASNDPFVRDFVSTMIGRATGMNIAKLALGAGGFAMNPQLQVLFSEVGFRRFSFDFVFTPYSQEETESAFKIIEQFKYAAAPQIDSNGIFGQGMYMKVPDTFKIEFLYDGKLNYKVHQIGECVLEDIKVDYAPNGWSTFNDGAPTQIKLSLTFKETVIVDKNKIKQGY
jgi:hypothetical protein